MPDVDGHFARGNDYIHKILDLSSIKNFELNSINPNWSLI